MNLIQTTLKALKLPPSRAFADVSENMFVVQTAAVWKEEIVSQLFRWNYTPISVTVIM